MARGIHLKELRSADLEAIGVPDDGLLPRTAQGEAQRRLGLLAEADPILSQALGEVRQGLEATLRLLDDALSAVPSAQPPRTLGRR